MTTDSIHTEPTASELGAFGHLDEAACWEILARSEVGRLGVVHRRLPLIFPVNYVVDDRSVVFRSGVGIKLGAAALSRRAVFEVDEIDPQFQRGVSVMLHGWLHEITDEAELAHVRQLPLRPWAGGGRDHFIRLHSGQVTGRGIGVSSVHNAVSEPTSGRYDQ